MNGLQGLFGGLATGLGIWVFGYVAGAFLWWELPLEGYGGFGRFLAFLGFILGFAKISENNVEQHNND